LAAAVDKRVEAHGTELVASHKTLRARHVEQDLLRSSSTTDGAIDVVIVEVAHNKGVALELAEPISTKGVVWASGRDDATGGSAFTRLHGPGTGWGSSGDGEGERGWLTLGAVAHIASTWVGWCWGSTTAFVTGEDQVFSSGELWGVGVSDAECSTGSDFVSKVVHGNKFVQGFFRAFGLPWISWSKVSDLSVGPSNLTTAFFDFSTAVRCKPCGQIDIESEVTVRNPSLSFNDQHWCRVINQTELGASGHCVATAVGSGEGYLRTLVGRPVVAWAKWSSSVGPYCTVGALLWHLVEVATRVSNS